MDHRTTERSTSDSLGDVSWIQKAALQPYRRNVPLLHTSRYVIPRDSVYQAFPRVSTASDKRWGEKAWVRGYHSTALRIQLTAKCLYILYITWLPIVLTFMTCGHHSVHPQRRVPGCSPPLISFDVVLGNALIGSSPSSPVKFEKKNTTSCVMIMLAI